MDWRDQGILLSSRRHGETSAIIEAFTPDHGRHMGVVRGGAGRRIAPILQPGAQLDLHWRARLEDHLGSFTVEPVKSRAAAVMGDRLALSALNAVTALLSFSLPEREPHPPLYHRSVALLDMLGTSELWQLAYLHWELALLDEMGFGLDLSACAVTGATEGLAYVSPRSGRAVTAEGAGDWKDRLLPLPGCLRVLRPAPAAEIAEALRVTGYFLETNLAPSLGDRPLPAARQRFADLQARQG
ncbi:DNA repair protein RecO [Psychromarinibacter sp. C21-152]|uniref:DNA repair protein RecO n=1 Tax=Psychromarinibacter sediminicola TaxID=3033385 RepID=A0AAE3T828_9RHOB|nr:DNA repair protein RecO [Psychromarinibacter sediminicola]MDF0600817.1 DNA repair protein RecO [Psychromarinibacter sediminicola]